MRILCVVDSELALREMSVLSESIRRIQGDAEFSAVYFAPSVRSKDFSAFATAREIEVVKPNLFERFGGLFKSAEASPIPGLFRYLGLKTRFRKEKAIVEACLNEFRPERILIASDRSIGLIASFAAVAVEMGIPLVIPPIALSSSIGPSTLRGSNRRYRAAGRFTPFWNRFIARKYPAQVKVSSFGAQLFFPGPVASALAAAKLLPRKPWALGGSFADRICVSGTADVSRLVGDGLSAKRILVTGSVSQDALFASMKRRPQIRKDVSVRYETGSNRPLAILAAPQFAEHGLLDWDLHWKEQEFLVRALTESGFDVLVSLHPKSDRAKYLVLEENEKCKILDEPVRDVLSGADLFVAGYSSVVEWAVICGVPTVVFDFFDYRYPIFDHLSGVEIFHDRERFRSRLRELGGEKDRLEAMKSLVRDGNPDASLVDGNASHRIRDAIYFSHT